MEEIAPDQKARMDASDFLLMGLVQALVQRGDKALVDAAFRYAAEIPCDLMRTDPDPLHAHWREVLRTIDMYQRIHGQPFDASSALKDTRLAITTARSARSKP